MSDEVFQFKDLSSTIKCNNVSILFVFQQMPYFCTVPLAKIKLRL